LRSLLVITPSDSDPERTTENISLQEIFTQAPVLIAVLKGREGYLELFNPVFNKWSPAPGLHKPMRETWPELKDQGWFEMIEKVFDTGETMHGKEFPSTNQWHTLENTEKTYFNFTYSPLRKQGVIDGVMILGFEVTDQVNSRQKMEESELYFRRMADSAPVFIWRAGTDKLYTYFNKRWLDFTGRPLEHEIGQGWTKGVHPEDLPHCLDVFNTCFDARAEFKLEYRLRNADGKYRWLQDHAMPLYTHEGIFSGYIGSCTDINDIKETERRKDDFIKMASHELKTPVTSIKGYAQWLYETYRDTNDTLLLESLKTIDSQIDKLTKLITELLDLSKIELGQLRFRKQVFDFDELVYDTIEMFKYKSLSHTIYICGKTEKHVLGDRDRIAQVITNLISNAIKYSPKADRVDISLSTNDSEVELRVKDYGIGIDPTYHEKIFERFYRVEGRTEDTFPGFGIGLFIAEEIMTRHKGKIGIESEKGKGSTFCISLPTT
jgi:PAS domain S-box-containing protein